MVQINIKAIQLINSILKLLPNNSFRQLKWIFYKYFGDKTIIEKPDILQSKLKSITNNIRSKKKMILVIDREIVTPDMDSGSFRMNEILKILVKKYEVIFLPANLQYNKNYSAMMRNNGIEILVLSDYYKTVEFFKTSGKLFDFVLLSRPDVAYNYLPLTRKYCVNSAIIYDSVDLHYIRFKRESAIYRGTARISMMKKSRRYKKIESQIINSVDQTWVISDDEKDIVSTLTKDVKVIPNIHPVVNIKKEYHSTKDILFIGGFQHTPNVDAMIYFTCKIFPEILKQIADIKLIIIGSNPPQSILNLESENIIVKGYVKDLSMSLSNARVSIAPIRFGAGMKGKIGLTLSNGIPTVSTTIGAEGFGFSGNELIIQDDPLKFAEAVVDLYKDEQKWSKYKTAGLKFMDKFATNRVEKQIFASINTLTGIRGNL